MGLSCSKRRPNSDAQGGDMAAPPSYHLGESKFVSQRLASSSLLSEVWVIELLRIVEKNDVTFHRKWAIYISTVQKCIVFADPLLSLTPLVVFYGQLTSFMCFGTRKLSLLLASGSLEEIEEELTRNVWFKTKAETMTSLIPV